MARRLGGMAGRLCPCGASAAEPIRPCRNRQFTSHETVARFYAKTAREEPLNGKRLLEIYLALDEAVVDRPRRPKGSTKASRAAA